MLTVCLFAGVSAPAVFAQTAGDEQYQDPFSDEGAGDTTGTADGENLSQTPQTDAGVDDGSSPESEAPSAPTTSTPQARQLPNTGSDARLLALAGFSLLLLGAGTRLRTIPEW